MSSTFCVIVWFDMLNYFLVHCYWIRKKAILKQLYNSQELYSEITLEIQAKLATIAWNKKLTASLEKMKLFVVAGHVVAIDISENLIGASHEFYSCEAPIKFSEMSIF